MIVITRGDTDVVQSRGTGGDSGLSGLVVRCCALRATMSIAPRSDDRLCRLVAGEQVTGSLQADAL